MKTYVWEASIEIQWEAPIPLGLFFKKSDAKKACETHAATDNLTIKWDNSDPKHSVFFYTDGARDFYSVYRREVK